MKPKLRIKMYINMVMFGLFGLLCVLNISDNNKTWVLISIVATVIFAAKTMVSVRNLNE